jgi:formylglycine-generating enzyme required for sulfatase activity
MGLAFSKKFHFTIQLLTFLMFISISFLPCLANNIQVTNVSLTDQSTQDHFSYIQFDIAWENSWRTSLAPNNWDAAWVFIKYKVSDISGGDGVWRHAIINTNGFTAPSGSTITPASDGTGAFIFRSTDGTGTFTVSGAQLRWNYGLNIKNAIGPTYVDDNDIVDIKVFAIEMVYVPQGSFYLGDRTSYSTFFQYPNLSNPYFITSEGEIQVGTTNGDLHYDSLSWKQGDESGPIPSTFPKGFSAFYCMKYELTQQQYVDFLNCLTQTQANNRIYTKTVDSTRRYGITGNSPGNFTTTNPYVPVIYLSWGDLGAFLDWAGLRFMTELEYEKACRGPLSPVNGEYSWGSGQLSSLVECEGIIYEGAYNELSLNSNANCCYRSTTERLTGGPIRVGMFANVSTNRQQSGATYYGIMEMSGNVWERCVTVGNLEGRSYQGIHGDGSLDGSGNYNVPSWPDPITEIGGGFRGGHYDNSKRFLRISDRESAGTYPGRESNYPLQNVKGSDFGGRGIRTAP